MAQLRHDHDKFQALNTEVLAIVPNGPRSIARHVSHHKLAYPVLSDKGSLVAAQYGISIRQTKLIRLALMTITVFLVDRSRVIRYAYYPKSYLEEPENGPPLSILSQLELPEPDRQGR